MKVLIVFDSYFGNTEKVAQAIGSALKPQHQVELVRVADLKPEQRRGVDLLIVGSPTRAFKPSEGIQRFLKSLGRDELKGTRVAAFDTRISAEDTKSGMLRSMIKLFGYAASPIAKGLQKMGGELAVPPEGFFVTDSEGPLKDGELERAAAWARSI